MRIAIVATNAWPIPTPVHTGDIVILDLARALKQLGHDVTLYAPAGTEFENLRETMCHNGTGEPDPRYCEEDTWNRYSAELRDCDVVHDWSTTKFIAAGLRGIGHNNVVSTVLGGVWPCPHSKKNVIAWSHAQRQRLLRGETDYWGTPTPQLGGPGGPQLMDAHVVLGGVDTEFYSPGPAPLPPPRRPYVLWMNRWHPAKGAEEALRIAEWLPADWRLVVAGLHPEANRWASEADYATNILTLALENGNPPLVHWLPDGPTHHARKRDLYRGATALLYPVQFQEPFGLSMVEAMACGTPVVGYSYGSVPEVVTDGVTGVLVTPGDREGLAAGCRRAARLDREAIRAHALERFSTRAMAERYLIEYRTVLEGGSWG